MREENKKTLWKRVNLSACQTGSDYLVTMGGGDGKLGRKRGGRETAKIKGSYCISHAQKETQRKDRTKKQKCNLTLH